MENEGFLLPKISVIILSHKNNYFSKGYLNYSLKSVLNQVYPNIEIIIVNNNPFQIEMNERNVKIIDTYNISRGES